jgi:ketosteroid isomerase-like protein
MKRNFFFQGMAVMLLAASLNIHAQSEASDAPKEIRSQIEKMNAKMADAMIKGDYTSNLSNYADDAYSLPSYSPMIQGKNAIKKSAEEMANTPMKITSFKTDIEEIIPGDNLYVEVGTYNMSMEMEGMPEPMKDQGKYVTVWEKQDDGSLKIKVETWNSDSNPWNQQSAGN